MNAEEVILDAWETLSFEIRKKLMQVLQERLVPNIEVLPILKRKNSIRLYFLCSTQRGVELLRDLLESGQLKIMIEELFRSFIVEAGVGDR